MEQRASTVTENPILSSLREPRRQHTLRILLDRTSPLDLRELATNLTAAEQEQPLLDVAPKDVDAIQAALHHVHLPKLEEAGLIDWNQSAGTVTTTNHPTLSDPKFQQMVAIGSPGWNTVIANLAVKRRRVILATLKDAESPLTRIELARGVISRESGAVDDEQDPAEDLLVELHHIHLPKLEQAELISYDTNTGTATYNGHVALDDEWLDFRPNETPRAIVPSARYSDDIWTIEGRDNVIAHGQSLFEQADDELFLMLTTDGLLEDGCVRRLQDAIDRGVDVYLGSQSTEVRDLVRKQVPGATIWEPQLDWLNLPPEHEKVGRFVMADRETIMLATLGAETSNNVHSEETAITGSGENNPLVMMMREMLGARLDHLDAQSEDFLEQIPL
ncbi:hypothetical protein GWG54_20190 [Natronococcus sp. JC468]|uniref:DUF7344 domain-containing protein n=1 Tax=Natronococcus sp. JC468 TaxID=1961921 RepID=UPI00143AAE64|nr:hypothetical protein [Natronococcus sp. JC468]NKE38067.1 hypothetical protein [Natronococcus sp. JC468]